MSKPFRHDEDSAPNGGSHSLPRFMDELGNFRLAQEITGEFREMTRQLRERLELIIRLLLFLITAFPILVYQSNLFASLAPVGLLTTGAIPRKEEKKGRNILRGFADSFGGAAS